MPSPFAGPRGQSPAGTPAVDLLSLARSPPAPFEATLSPPLGQFVINSSLQAAALLAAVAFGVFAIRSVRMAQTANLYAAQALNQSIIANGLALVSICLSGINTVSRTGKREGFFYYLRFLVLRRFPAIAAAKHNVVPDA
jgi:hypothetical protein